MSASVEWKERYDQGGLALDGSDEVPLSYLWYPTALVADLIERETGRDLVIIWVPRARPTGPVLDEVQVPRHRADIKDLRRRFSWCSFERADRILTRCGLHVDMLGEPTFSIGCPR